ncbi:MAG: pilus assembly protein TadG-related protein, partial [Chloroflexi bacterium]|nr:pilus assembly protein TadG-related protein [Chloroflexota bacterium]
MFAIVVIALIAVTALVIDTGFLFGQRRYDQNGADAAALAAARLMATSVSPFDNNGNTFFAVSDADVYNEALKYVNPNQ